MEIRNAVHPDHAATFDTEELREHFLIQGLFEPNQYKLVYSYFDRLIVGGVCPISRLTIDIDEKIIGSPYLLDRRELGLINVGGPGVAEIDGEMMDLVSKDGGQLRYCPRSPGHDHPRRHFHGDIERSGKNNGWRWCLGGPLN